MLHLREVGANNGWQADGDVDYEYYDQCLERDPKILARLSPQQMQELSISPNAALCDPAHGDAGKPKTL